MIMHSMKGQPLEVVKDVIIIKSLHRYQMAAVESRYNQVRAPVLLNGKKATYKPLSQQIYKKEIIEIATNNK